MEKRWFLNKTNKEYVKYLSDAANISPITAQVLINRNMKTPQEVSEFLTCNIGTLSDPFKLSGIDTACIRIKKAIRDKERILIHGDYDSDGVTATAILVDVLKRLGGGGFIDYFIPSRFDTGYGFHPSTVEQAHKNGVSLIITVDCGITSHDTVEKANSLGIDVVVTDHHEPLVRGDGPEVMEGLPPAHAVINPKLMSVEWQGAQLSGAGVALMLGLALFSGRHEDIASLLDIAAIGTIADVVPLMGDNRIIVKEGLKGMGESKRPGIRELMNVANVTGKEIRADLLSYTIIPRLNAAGRMDNATNVVRLLTTDSIDEAKRLAYWLDGLNQERQKIENEVLESAIRLVDNREMAGAIVIAEEDWHEGVLGIVASRMVDRYKLPSFVLNIRDGVAKGSARSVHGLDICACLEYCRDYLIQFGGHKQAAGLKLRAEHIGRFRDMVRSYVSDTFDSEGHRTSLTIDSDVSLKDINHRLLSEFSMLAPFGYYNPEPLLGARGLKPFAPRIVGKNHIKLSLRHNGSLMDAIGFDLGECLSWITSVDTVDAVFTPTINDWNGNQILQLNLKDIRPGVNG